MKRLDYTDSWHPTVNPSARMPIHHLRFVELLGHNGGILNESPRRYGGSTLRVLRIHSERATVVELPGALPWTPWWLPANHRWARELTAETYERALSGELLGRNERAVVGQLLEDFRAECRTTGLTVGEALWRVADRLHRHLIPSLPEITLTSITRSPARRALADGLSAIPGGPLRALARWADGDGTPVWPLLAVATAEGGVPLRIRLHARSARLDIEPLHCDPDSPPPSHKPQEMSEETLVAWLRAGRLVPGARLVALAEAGLCRQGWTVRHLGNTYGHTAAAADVIGAPPGARGPLLPG